MHSRWSPDSSTQLETLAARCAEIGLTSVALTDHNTAEGALELARRYPELAIVGEEVRTTEGEIIGLFLRESIPARLTPEETIEEIRRQGGLTYVAHPLDRYRAHFSAHRLVELAPGLDIFETYNPWARMSDNQAAAQLCADLGKVPAAGSDAHSPAELGHSWMEMEAFDGPEDFLDKLRRAEHVITSASGAGRRA